MTGDADLLERVKRGRFLIGGQWIEPGGRQLFDIVTPSNQTVFASVPCATREDMADAVASARQAFDNGPWPTLAPRARPFFSGWPV